LTRKQNVYTLPVTNRVCQLFVSNDIQGMYTYQ